MKTEDTQQDTGSRNGGSGLRCFDRLVLRFRWWVAAPLLRPLRDEAREYTANMRRAAREIENMSRETRLIYIEKSDSLDAQWSEIEAAFGCTSYDKKMRSVRHYQ